MLTTAKNRAKVKGVAFDLTEKDISVPVFCPILGIKLESGIAGSGNNDAAPSLDRIIPELGYVRGNVVVVSNKANRMKSNGTAEELRLLADFYTQLAKERQCQKTTTSTGAIAFGTSTASPLPKRKEKMKPKEAMHLALIDGDLLAYWASFGAEAGILLEEDVMTYTADLEVARERVEGKIEDIREALRADKIIVALSDDDRNFRKELFATYKENRKANRKPLALKHVREHLRNTFGAIYKDGLEADDVLGILATHPEKFTKFKKIIVSTDKDLLQIPGRNFNPDKKEKRMVSEKSGRRQHAFQTLTGDSVDHYPGCPGIGPKRANAILDAAEENFWPAIKATFEKAGLEEEDALMQARIARILQHTDYDFTKKEPKLWTPN